MPTKNIDHPKFTGRQHIPKSESFKLFNRVAKTYDFLNHFLSAGIDIYWRKKLCRLLPQKSEMQAVDLATGTADLAIELAKQKNISHVIGIDLSEGMLAIGRDKVRAKNMRQKIDLRVGDGVEIPLEEKSCDLVTISFGIRNFYNPEKSLENIWKTLRPGGHLYIMEFSLPSNFIIRTLYTFYFRKVLPFLGGLVSGDRKAYKYLNVTVEDFPYGKAFEDMMTKANFHNVHSHKLTFGIATLYIGKRPGTL